MKKLLLFFVTLFTLSSLLFNYSIGVTKIDPKEKLKLKKPDIVDGVFIGYNNWKYVMRNNGSYMYDSPDLDGNGNTSGGEFPRGSNRTIVFAAGLYVGALKNGIPIVSQCEFGSEFQPGKITNSNVPFRQLTAESPDLFNQRVYFIHYDDPYWEGDLENWPGDHLTNGAPALIADAQTWAVFNDLDTTRSTENVTTSPFPGLGLQVTLESFASKNLLSADAVFFRLTIENKTNTDYDSTFIGIWMDPDVNDASDDIPGTDSLANLVYAYDAENSDYYPNASVGIILLQGPLVNTSEIPSFFASKFGANTKKMQFDSTSGYYRSANLPAGQIWLGTTTAPPRSKSEEPRSNLDRYFFLSGRNRLGQSYGNAYAYPGDPITQQGSPYVANISAAGDWRMISNCGPFFFRAGDKQDIWYAVVGGEAQDRLGAFAAMRQQALRAKTSFVASLTSYLYPVSPTLEVHAYEGKNILTWDNAAEFSEDLFGERASITKAGGYSDDYIKYDFQGYRVYRSLTGLFDGEPIAQFDKIDNFGIVHNRHVGANGQLVIDEIHVGDNTGLQHTYVDEDVTIGKKYYYTVTAYDAQPYIGGPDSMVFDGLHILTPSGIPVSLETNRYYDVHSAVPYRNTSVKTDALVDSIYAHHPTGTGDGYIEINVINPDLVKSGDYSIEFFTIPEDSAGGPLVGGEFLPANRIAYRFKSGGYARSIDFRRDDPRTYYDVNHNGRFDDSVDRRLNEGGFCSDRFLVNEDNTGVLSVIIDGIEVRVFDYEKGFKSFEVSANAGGPINPHAAGAASFLGSGPNAFPCVSNPDGSQQQQQNGTFWFINNRRTLGTNTVTGSFPEYVANCVTGWNTFATDPWEPLNPNDFEIRFTAAGSVGQVDGTTTQFNLPFEVWNVTQNRKLLVTVIDDDSNGTFGVTPFDHPVSSNSNDPMTDRFYIWDPNNTSPGTAGYDEWVLANYDINAANHRILGRQVFVSWNGGDVTDPSWPNNIPLGERKPEQGTIFGILANKPLTPGDTFTFTTSANTALTKAEGNKALDKIKAVPNPFYIGSAYQTGNYDKILKFINLPPVCSIKIFTVAGDLVRTLHHTGTSNNERTDPVIYDMEGNTLRYQETSIEVWDLKTANYRYVASGMYIALIESPYGKKFVKFAVIQ